MRFEFVIRLLFALVAWIACPAMAESPHVLAPEDVQISETKINVEFIGVDTTTFHIRNADGDVVSLPLPSVGARSLSEMKEGERFWLHIYGRPVSLGASDLRVERVEHSDAGDLLARLGIVTKAFAQAQACTCVHPPGYVPNVMTNTCVGQCQGSCGMGYSNCHLIGMNLGFVCGCTAARFN